MSTRYTVGIDLGTSNSAMSFAEPTEDGAAKVEMVRVPQLVNPGEVAERTLLPSFLYVPGDLDFPKGSLALPWNPSPRFVVGELARKRGSEAPVRLVASAKSWLSYAAADRTAPILPWGAPDEVPKLSPVDASAEYLRYLREVWDARHGADAPLSAQDVLLTVPASFDEEGRELTLRAAEIAGLANVTLLEEPQAAFYAWIDRQGEAWRRRVRVGDLILVCDIGGGTTDFSLIAVSEEGGELRLQRVAVGDHILLGGDNMDLALARLLQQKLEAQGHRVDQWQLLALWYQSRAAKEALFRDPQATSHPITLLGKGRRLVGGTISTELLRDEVYATLVDGFFPRVGRDEMPARQRRIGLQELSLPYAADPAITKHLARFLSQQAQHTPEGVELRRAADGFACPTHILFNGGVMNAAALRERLIEVLNGWLTEAGFEPLGEAGVLDAPDLDQAVARGAAYYGVARRGRGVRIRAGAPRSYYVGIETAMPSIPGMPAPLKALCVVPFGMEEGTGAEIPGREFGLVVGEPAQFRFLSSTSRQQDRVGTMVEDWDEGEIVESSPLEVTLRVDGQEDTVLPVRLESRVTEVGTLELWCVSRDGARRWKLEFNIRQPDQPSS